MAKKTAKTTKKKTTEKKTTAKKVAPTRTSPAKATSAPKSNAKSPAAKKTTSKKTTAKKTVPGKSAPKQSAPKQSTVKKTTSKKATTTKKTPTSKKVTTSKKVSSAKKPTTNKKVAPKQQPAPSNSDNHTPDTSTPKTAPDKPTPTKSSKKPSKKSPVKSGSNAKSSNQDAASGAKSKPSLQSGASRFRSHFAGEANVGRAAAARLADLAGITPIRASEAHSTEKAKPYKRITKSPHTAAQLAEFRELLITKRRQLVGDVTSMEREALSGNGGSLSRLSQHMADQGSDVFDQTLNLDLAASQRRFLTEIDDAIDRIDNGTYGICELLGKPIGLDRLRNTPWARFSIEAARQIEINPALARTVIAE